MKFTRRTPMRLRKPLTLGRVADWIDADRQHLHAAAGSAGCSRDGLRVGGADLIATGEEGRSALRPCRARRAARSSGHPDHASESPSEAPPGGGKLTGACVGPVSPAVNTPPTAPCARQSTEISAGPPERAALNHDLPL